MLVLVVAAVSGVATLAAALFPQVEFVYSAPALHVAFETAGGLIALLAGFLIGVRFLRRARLTELTLTCSLGVLALTELAFATVPAGQGRGSTDLSVWAAMGGRALCGVLFAAAVFLPDRRLRRPRLDLALGAGVVTVTPLLIAGAAVVFAPRLPGVTVAATGLPLPTRADLHADAVLIRSELALAMIYCLAAAGFLRRAERSRDEFSGWLAAAAVLAAASHMNYFLYPVMYLPLVSLGDVLRLCSCAVLLAGSSREISTYWLTSPDAAALEERRRIARDLRDGLAQNLAYLLGNLDSLDGAVGAEMRAHLRRAAERAQIEARLAIVRLTGTPAEPINGPVEPINGTAAGVAAGRRWRLRLRPVAPRLVSIRPRSAAEDSSFSGRDDELTGIGPEGNGWIG